MCRYKILFIVLLAFFAPLRAQKDTPRMNMDAIYGRPFLSLGKSPVAIGGYLEANTQYAVTDGVSEGLSFQARRLTLFISSSLGKHMRFLSEIEFEDGTKEINIEFAALDVEFNSQLNLRGGIVMNPIGAFNQNHDGPRWDFIDRPLQATTILPATLSNVGFGLHGKWFFGRWILGYETYLTNGFDGNIIANSENRTSLAAGKSNPEKFEESFNGSPMFTGKIALRNRKIGELGISYMDGAYNQFNLDGVVVDERRHARTWALDLTLPVTKRFNVLGEFAVVQVELPPGTLENFGESQYGMFLDLIATIWQKPIMGWDKARLNLVLRTEYVDYNVGNFAENGEKKGDEILALVPGFAFRPTATTVFRTNYRYHWSTDLLGNAPARTGIFQVGFSTYF